MISGVCHRHFPNDPDIVLACISRLQSQKGYDKADLDDAIAMATYSQRFVNTFQTNTLFLGPVILIVNTYFFAYLWARVFRVHVNPTGKDREGIRHAYLVTMGTTLLIPSIIATFTILVSELIQRSGVPWTLISFAPTIAFFANLPIFVAMMLTAQRLHRLLNKAEDWRIGKPVAIMLLSNLLTCIVVFPLIAILIVWL